MKLHPISWNGQALATDEFAFTLRPGAGFNPEGVDQIAFRCPNAQKQRTCLIALTLGDPIAYPASRRWHWNGSMERPTIIPSIGCDQRCGWHGHITNGEIQP